MEVKRTWLKDIRVSQGLTQHNVAQLANIKREYYNMIENGKRSPSTTVAQDIARSLGFNWVIFFENECNDMKRTICHTN